MKEFPQKEYLNNSSPIPEDDYGDGDIPEIDLPRYSNKAESRFGNMTKEDESQKTN